MEARVGTIVDIVAAITVDIITTGADMAMAGITTTMVDISTDGTTIIAPTIGRTIDRITVTGAASITVGRTSGLASAFSRSC